ncbi:MAG: histidinol-phosphatase HisJ family protein [Dorea longicatena]
MIQADMHMHTWFSTDSEACPRDMADEAVRKGLKTICFTDHFDKDDLEWGEEGIFDVDAYFVEMQKLQEEYAGKLNIRIGMELGLRTYLKDYYEELTKKYPFDFVIGSVHNVPYKKDAEGKILYTDPAAEKLFTDRTDKEAYRLMMETTLENVRTSDCFQTLGHLDYVVRYGKSREKEYSYTDYADIIDEILKLLIEKEKGLEVNSAGLKYGLPFAHPHPDVLKRYRELGGEIITIGADAHKPEHIAYDFAKVEEILKSCGFKYYTEFFEQKPVFKQLI